MEAFKQPDQHLADGVGIHHESGDVAFKTGGTTKMTLKSDGKVGIGVDSPNSILEINAGSSSNSTLLKSSASSTVDCSHVITSDSTQTGRGFAMNGYNLSHSTASNRKLIFQSTKSGDGSFDSTGGTNGGYGNILTCISTGHVLVAMTNSQHSSYKFQINGSGLAHGGTFVNSDDRIKFNEENINSVSALSIINQLQPQKYEKITELPQDISGTWIPTDAEWPDVKDNYVWGIEAGLIAQDVRAIPELAFAVVGEEVNSEGTQIPLTLNYNDIYVYHIVATKELSSQLDTEKAKTANLETQMESANGKIAVLETQVADLIARVSALESA